ncbi:hotdog domain-containing protein [Microbacterium sp. ISL-103]|uniref:acyl-CoA thioesterase n=1 Tax=Microbacterium sp. ISL-103 TaxID=2819156 RepID=UPI00288B4F02|nr:hotdog domain-containing protein [Microbacterium sp. ISL-103]
MTLRFVATPQDAGFTRDAVAAGSILEWIDKAGYVCAVGWSSAYCVTAYVGNVHYTRQIRPGELVEASAQIVHTGRTSMHVLVRLSSADTRAREYVPAMHCLLVFVAVDDEGRPTEVREWIPESVEDRTLQENARQRVALRQAIHREMKDAVFSGEGTTPRTIFRFLAPPTSANFAGNAHGGTVMRWIDDAAYACSAGWSSNSATAIYTGGIHFYRPIHIGEIVEVDALLIHVADGAMPLSVHVRSADPRRPTEMKLATQCMTIFEDRIGVHTVRPVPLLMAEDRALNELAQKLVEMRATLPRVPDGASARI